MSTMCMSHLVLMWKICEPMKRHTIVMATVSRVPMVKSPRIARDSPLQKQPSTVATAVSEMLLGNTSWELFDGIPKQYSLRTRVRLKLKYSRLGLTWEIFQTLFALLVSVLYVLQTYEPELKTEAFDLTAVVVFSTDYLLQLYSCENRYEYLMSFTSIMDIVTILPAIFDRVDSDTNGSNHHKSFPFLRFIRVLRLLRLTRLIRVAGSRSISAVQKQIHTIVLLILCIVFISAGIFHAVENGDRSEGAPQITFGDALYFLVVTMATVGFGDIAPTTTGGKAVAVAVIIISFTVIPTELARLKGVMALKSQFRRFYHPSIENPHVLVVGHVTDPRTLLDFFRELYHPDRLHHENTKDASGTTYHEPPSVLLGPEEPSEAIVALLDHPILQNRVTFVKGSVLAEEDLCRVAADVARACFVLVPKSTHNVSRADADTVLRLLAIRNYSAELEIYTQIHRVAYMDYMSEVNTDHVLCLEQLKMSMIAKSCLCPGLVPLISNMFRSSAASAETIRKRRHSILHHIEQRTTPSRSWRDEYAEGLALEIYATRLPPSFFGLTFEQVCDILYKCSHGEIIMMGVYVPSSTARLSTRGGIDSPPSKGVLPALNVQDLRPHSSSSTGSTSRMYINPGRLMLMAAGQLVYVLSESRKLTLTASIAQQLKEWLTEGHTLPLPAYINPDQQSVAQTEIDAAQVKMHVTSPSPRRARSHNEVLIEDAVDPVTGKPLENHIVIVTDLDAVSIYSIVQRLRQPHLRRIDPDYHVVLFLSWSTNMSIAAACRALQPFNDVFLMMAAHPDSDSKAEFLRANVLHAARCVLLSDKTAISKLDGEMIDSRTIFHYLALLRIQSEYGVDTTSGLMPIVELTLPRTMKILDTALQKRTLRSFLHRQQMDREEGIPALVDTVSAQFAKKRGSLRIPHHRKGESGKIKTSLLRQLLEQNQLRRRLQERHMKIRQEQDDAVHQQDSNTTTLLPFFAAGYAFSDDIFDNMLCQSFFTPGLVRFINALLFSHGDWTESEPPTDQMHMIIQQDSSDEEAENEDASRAEKPVTLQKSVCSLSQIHVPQYLIGKTFGDLFHELVTSESIVPIGLFRGTNTPFSLPYVATGPTRETVLVKDDLVFVLAQPASLKRLHANIQKDIKAESIAQLSDSGSQELNSSKQA